MRIVDLGDRYITGESPDINYSIMNDNLEGQLTILKLQLQELAISFGEILLPAVKSIVSFYRDLSMY